MLAGLLDLFAKNFIALAHDAHLFRRQLADHADSKARTREGLAVNEALGKAERESELSHLILEQHAQRFDKTGEAQFSRQTAHVVMALDDSAALDAAALDHIGIDRALGKMIALTQLRGGVLEYLHKFPADDFSLLFRLGHAFERSVEAFRCIDSLQLHREGPGENVHHLIALSGAHEAVIHIDAGQAIANRAIQQRSGNRAVHAAGQSQQYRAIADLPANLSNGALRIGFHRPVGLDFADAEQEVFQHRHAFLGMGDLRVELHAVELSFRIRHGCGRAVGGVGDDLESLGRLNHLPGMAHPADAFGPHALQQSVLILIHVNDCPPVLALYASFDHAAQQMRRQLHAVADSQHRHAQVKYGGINGRRAFIQYAGGAAGQNDAQRLLGTNIFRIGIVRQHGGIHAALAHAACNQLRILTAEI